MLTLICPSDRFSTQAARAFKPEVEVNLDSDDEDAGVLGPEELDEWRRNALKSLFDRAAQARRRPLSLGPGGSSLCH